MIREAITAPAVPPALHGVAHSPAAMAPFVDDSDVHYAQSGIYTPMDVSFARDGIAAECTPTIETLVIHDVDLELLHRHKTSGTVQNWNDRRRDMYRVAYRESADGPDLEA